ncbi:MAG: DUF4157 domain-containing protein [Pseudomonadota bacterium]
MMTTQQVKTNQNKPRRPAMSALMRRSKTASAHTHNSPSEYRQDKYEQQARRFGEHWLNRTPMAEALETVLPAPASSVRVDRSIAEPLPKNLQCTLGEFFHADLSQVRIHRDGPAQRMVAAEGARALTAGAHIYFSAGQYAPETASGSELLAHEITHTLQQTGRRSDRGTTRVTDITARGSVQFDYTFNEFVDLYKQHASTQLDIVQLDGDDTRGFSAIERALSTVLGLGVLGMSDFEGHELTEEEQTRANALNTAVVSGSYDSYSANSKSLLQDALRIWGFEDGPIHLLLDDPGIQTRYYPNDEFLNTLKGNSQVNSALQTALTADGSLFYNITSELWKSLTQTEYRLRPVPTNITHPETNLWATYDRHGEEFVENELVLFQADYLRRINILRLQAWIAAIRALKVAGQENPLSTVQIGHFVSNHIARNLNQIRPDEDDHMRRARWSLRNIARRAREFWDRVEQTVTDIRERSRVVNQSLLRGNDPHIPSVLEGLSLPQDEVLDSLVNLVAENAARLFSSGASQNDVEDGEVNGFQEYANNVQLFATSLNQFDDTISDRISQVFRSAAGSTRDNKVLWLTWAQIWTKGLRHRLESFSSVSEEASNGQDQMLMHRLSVIDSLNILGIVTDNQFLQSTARRILRAEDKGQSYLVLAGNWQVDNTAQLENLNEDFRNTVLRGIGIPTQTLVAIYQLFRARQFNESLENQLLAGEGDIGNQRMFMTNAVLEADALPMPTRWTNTKAIVVYHRDDENNPDAKLQELLFQHPAYQAFRDAHVATGGEVIVPFGYGHRILAWKLPPFIGVIKYLRSITALNNLVIELADTGIGVSHQAWFDAFVRLVEDGFGTPGYDSPKVRDKRRKLLRLLRGGVNGHIDEVKIEQRRLVRRVTTHRRRVLAAQSSNVLREYIDGDLRDYTKPNDVLREVENFLFDIHPRDTDQLPQQTALMLGIAPTLEDLFIQDTWLGTVREDRYDLITGFYNVVEQALLYSEAAENQAAIRSVLFLQENLEDQEADSHNQAGSNFEDFADLLGNRQHLVNIKNSMDTVILSQQERFGFESVDARNLKSLSFAHEFPEGAPMEIGGNIYRIIRVQRAFRYHPPYGNISNPIIRQPSGDPFPDGALILQYAIGTGETISVYNRSEDYHHLARLDEIIGLAAFVASLDALEEAILQAAELGLDILELVPGVGQGVMAARALASITVFIAQDLPNIKQELFENPTEILDQIVAYIDLDLARFVEILLFETFPFESRLIAPDTDDDDQPRRGRSRGHGARLRRLFDFVAGMTEEGMRAFVRLRGRIRRAFLQSQSSIVQRPMLMRVVEALPFLISLGAGAVRMAEAFDGIDNFDDIETKIKEEIENVMNGMAKVEIPADIIPLDLAASILLNFALSRLPGRKGKVIAEILEAVGAVDQAATLLKEAIEDTDANPNRLWRSSVRDALQPKLRSAQLELFQAVATTISTATGGEITLGTPNLESAEVETDDVEPAAEALDPMMNGEAGEEELPAVDFSGGEALAQAARIDLLKSFGHDFAHVRIHRNETAQKLTSAAGALALTSGSHVFLNQSVNMGTRVGEQILRHELSHVLQQTGPRPRGQRYSDLPVRGRSNTGLRINVNREHAADRMADMAIHRDYEEEPIPVLEEGGSGWMPTLAEVAARLVDNLVDDEIADNLADSFEQRVPRATQRKTTFMSAVTEARTIWNGVKTLVRANSTGMRYTGPMPEAREHIQAYVAGGLHSRINQYMNGIVVNSIRTRGNGRIELKPGTFANNLETYIFSRTGLVFSIGLNAQHRVNAVTVSYLHLPNLHRGTGLWQALVANTNIPESRKALFGSTGWGRLRAFISTRLHESEVFDGDHFRLSNDMISEAVRFFQNIGNISSKLGVWDDYKNTDPAHSANMGLRVSDHGDLTSRHQNLQFGGARESHHLPQYLLVEYFRNNATIKLFENNDGSDRLPGFKPLGQSNNLRTFNVGNSPTINFRTLDPSDSESSRGEGLPAISLASITHKKGRLHINAGGTWGANDENSGTATQAERLNNTFNTKLQGQGLPSPRSEIVSLASGQSESEQQATRRKIHTAMKQTYRSMYDMMMRALPSALDDYELPYYREVAMVKTDKESEDQLEASYRPGSVSHVISAVEAKNVTVMSEWRT